MWLVRDGDVLATLEVADSARGRSKGLLGRDGIEGALLLRPARSVHTIGMRFPIDVAFLDGALAVLATVTMRPGRIGMPRLGARAVIEAEAGAFARWSLRVGDQLEIKG
ncbi:MAG: DUF192 domain-containing protein [Acidimicrobiales bacterium]